MTKDFDKTFSWQNVVRALVRMRLRISLKRHAVDFFWSLGKNHNNNPAVKYVMEGENDVALYLPPRRQWKRAGKILRQTKGSGMSQDIALANQVLSMDESALQETSWGMRLKKLYDSVLRHASSPVIASPVLKLMAKPRAATVKDGHDETEYRCLAVYENLIDRIVLSCTARYLRSKFDGLMSAYSYAFRHDGSISYQTAIADLREYRLKYNGKKLYVAECDIQKFFDVVPHDVIMRAYDSFAERLSDPPEAWAREIVKSYLESYSSFRAVFECADSEIMEKRKQISFWSSGMLRKTLKKYHDGQDAESCAIGIPQGGALSPLLANLVMDAADRAVLSAQDTELFYARFCDDMIIAHTKKKTCKEALERYLNIMKVCKLPVHQVCKKFEYCADYYARKSKGPFLWDDVKRGACNAAPWVSFLGVQIRFNGDVRVRNDSIEKHKKKLSMERTLLIRAIGRNGDGLRKPEQKSDAMKKFTQRMLAIGIGYCDDNFRGTAMDKCWMGAYPQLSDCSETRRQLSTLDAHRDAILRSIKKNVFQLTKDDFVNGMPDFLGRPYSYLGYLVRIDRPQSNCFWSDFGFYGLS